MKAIRRSAKSAGMELEFVRQGREHEVWRVGSTLLSIPRHREISPGVTRQVLKDLDAELEGR